MKQHRSRFRDPILTVGILCGCFCLSLLMHNVVTVQESITTVFVFGVFLISLATDGYIWGLLSAFAGMLAVNYAFTFPYFKLNFTIPENAFSAVVMVVTSVLTSTLTTKLKHHEAEKAEGERERMRANLLRAVSHDLRTPLTTIYGSSSALLEKDSALTQEQKTAMLKGIREDAQWLTRMVENLLSITRIDSGKVKIIKTPTVLEELIDAVMLKFKKRYPGQPVELDLPEELLMIPMDALLIQQVLINLLENAVQHARGMTCLRLGVRVQGGRALFEVRDNGCGISEDRLPHLFTGDYDPPNPSADSRRRNAGIGLSVCASIIKAHGGEIQAENLPGGGALFRFALRLEEPEDE